jgi:hypothetical protein
MSTVMAWRRLRARVRRILGLPPIVVLNANLDNELARLVVDAQRREAERLGWQVRLRRL